MQSAEVADKNKASTARLATESNLSIQKKRRSKDITELKVEAENLKVSLSSLTTEREKSQAKERTAYFDDLFQLLETTSVKMDRKVLEHIADLLKLNVDPDNILEFLRTVSDGEKGRRGRGDFYLKMQLVSLPDHQRKATSRICLLTF